MQQPDEHHENNDLEDALDEIIKKTEEMEKRIEEILAKTKKRADQ